MEHSSIATATPTQTVLSNALDKFFGLGYSVALWRRPNTTTIFLAASSGIRSITEVNLEESTPGFVFAPFHPDQSKLYLPADELLIFEQNQSPKGQGSIAAELAESTSPVEPVIRSRRYTRQVPSFTSPDHTSYTRLVMECTSMVKAGRFEKLVPSRFRHVDIDPDLDVLFVFEKLCRRYPHAMVSLFSSPESGTWMGATPELLVSVEGKRFQTVAVAGTQPYQEGMDIKAVTWNQKEIEEQALVERYIISCFKKIRLREYDELGPRTTVAGNLLHLKTEFVVDMQETNFPQLGSVMLKLLHPTSAVCGSPLKESLEFLQKHEGYDRQFYSGYLGPVHMNGDSHLYVNLRCMQLFSEQAMLYAGAGVVEESDPEKEWLETEMKMNTLLQIIRP